MFHIILITCFYVDAVLVCRQPLLIIVYLCLISRNHVKQMKTYNKTIAFMHQMSMTLALIHSSSEYKLELNKIDNRGSYIVLLGTSLESACIL